MTTEREARRRELELRLRANYGRRILPEYLRGLSERLAMPVSAGALASLPVTDEVVEAVAMRRAAAQRGAARAPFGICTGDARNTRDLVDAFADALPGGLPGYLITDDSDRCGAVQIELAAGASKAWDVAELEGPIVRVATRDGAAALILYYHSESGHAPPAYELEAWIA